MPTTHHYKRALLHFLFWLVYIYSQIYVEYGWILHFYPDNTPFEVFMMASTEEFLLLLVRIPMVYMSFYIFDKYMNTHNRYTRGMVYLLLLMATATFFYRLIVTKYILSEVYLMDEPEDPLKQERVVRAALDLLFLFALANGIRFYRSRVKMRAHEIELLKQKVETELNLLKSQINPHFLFNTLNNIYALALKNSSQTAPVVLKLSELMRFLLYGSGKESISILEEVKLVEDYIELESIRYNNRLQITFEKEIDDVSAQITPLLLLPLVENAFKHGASESSREAFISIRLRLKNKQFSFTMQNSVEDNEENQTGHGIGLKNVQRQLELVYKEFFFRFKKTAYSFIVKLEINLH